VGATEEVAVVAVLVGDVEGIVGSIAAAELILALGGGHVVVGVVGHEVANGFPGDLATFHHHVEVEH
jgi:formaldehyde-activating enzyme involved in methanogenesis